MEDFFDQFNHCTWVHVRCSCASPRHTRFCGCDRRPSQPNIALSKKSLPFLISLRPCFALWVVLSSWAFVEPKTSFFALVAMQVNLVRRLERVCAVGFVKLKRVAES
jgi:hypothetical protein